MSPELDAELKSAEETVLEVKRVLNKGKFPDDERTMLVVAFVDQGIEHHAAILFLMRSGFDGSAFALTRSVTEILVRGVWMLGCATDEQVKKFVKHDKIEQTFGELSEAVDKTAGLEYFSEFKKHSWDTLNSYAHTGMLQIGRRFHGDKLTPSYTDTERIEVLRAITSCILMLVRPFLAKHGQVDSAKEIDKLMVTPTMVQAPLINVPEKTGWDKIEPFLEILGICVLDACILYATKLHLDLLTGVALITLLFMMLQTEHERCDRVRLGWREVRHATFTTTSAIQWASKKQGSTEAEQYADAARASLQDWYGTLLLHGHGPLRDEYQRAVRNLQAAKTPLMQMLPVFGELDLKAERKFKAWKLVWL